jgi:hypothetical protein
MVFLTVESDGPKDFSLKRRKITIIWRAPKPEEDMMGFPFPGNRQAPRPK